MIDTGVDFVNPTSRRAFLGLGTSVGAAALLGACSTQHHEAVDLPVVEDSYGGPSLTLRFWNGLTGGDGATMRALLGEFSQSHPNITIEMFAIPWASFYQKFPAAVVSGLAPDLGLMQNFHVATNAARGVIVPLDEVAERIGLNQSNFPDAVWQSGIFAGQRYSIPLDVWPDSLFYNRRVLSDAGFDPDDPPQDRDSYENVLAELHDQGVAGHWVPAEAAGRSFDTLMWQFGGELYNEDGTRALFNSPEGMAAVEWLRDRIITGQSRRDVSGGDANVAFKNDLNAFMWGGPGALINDFGQVPGLDWDVAPLPVIGDHAAGFSGSHQFVIMRQREFDADRLAAAYTFLRWISDNSIGWAEAGPVPARRDVVDSAEFAALPAQSAVAQGLYNVRFYPLIPGIFEVQSTILYPAVRDVLLLVSEPDEALDRAVERADYLLTENAEKYAQAQS